MSSGRPRYPGGVWIRLWTRAYRVLTALYPASFGKVFGPDLARAFEDGLRDASGQSRVASIRFLFREGIDALRNLPAAWAERTRQQDRHDNGGVRGMMDALRSDLLFAVRGMRSRPGFHALLIGTLAAGIGAIAAVFAVADGVLFEPLPYPEPHQLVFGWESYQEDQTRSVSYLNYTDWRERNRTFEELGIRGGWGFTITGQGDAQQLSARVISANLLGLLGVEPVVGRGFTEEDESREARVAILSGELWSSRFGSDPSVVGRTITLDAQPWTVVGVLPARLEFPLQGYDLFTPITTISTNDRGNRGSHPGLYLVGRLREGTSLEQARADLHRVAAELEQEFPDTNREAGVVLIPLADAQLGDTRTVVTLLFGAVGLVLLIACANAANLLLARGRERQREASLRTALGASRARIARAYATESVVVGILGGTLGLGIAMVSLELFKALAPAGFPRLERASVDGSVVIFTVTVSALATLIVGLLPVVRLSRTSPAKALDDGGERSGDRYGGRARKLLVVAEVALSFVLLFGATQMLRTLDNLLAEDPGLRPGGVLVLELPVPQSSYPTVDDRARFYGEVIRRVNALPGVTMAGGGDPIPLTGSNRQWTLSGDGLESVGEEGLRSDQANVTPGYFETMGIPLVAGRDFDGRETAADPAAIIDETMARRLFPGGDPVGREIRFRGQDSPWMTIVGVVGHVKHYGVQSDSRVQIYLPYTANLWGLSLVVRVAGEGDPTDVLGSIRAIVSEVDPNIPVGSVGTMTEYFSASIEAEALATRVLTLFAGVALILALMGLYAVISYSVSLRTHEIGIRMALGARSESVLSSVAREGLGLAAIGIVVGSLAAVFSSRLFASLLFGLDGVDAGGLGGVALGVVAVTLLALWLPARQATRIDPISALRG